jgi:pimeloyl-ACP methyl ester carboxylesterase
LLSLALLVVASGCGVVHHEVRAPGFVPGQCGVVFTADGAGGFHNASSNLRRALDDAGLPLGVETVSWSHGYGRIAADLFDRCHQRAAGRELAEQVAAFRAAHPGVPVYLLGHSAGCQVVLSAAEALPPDSVRHIILLAPAVSPDYDLRPALRAARGGLDAFHSERDVFFLGAAVAVAGTTDGHFGQSAAGRVGFRVAPESPEDAALYTRLRQHPWDVAVAWTGNHGGHYSIYRPEYLRAYVLPLLTPAPVQSPRAIP